VRRIGLIAVREFLGTVMTRGFVVGLLLMPALIALTFVVGPRIMRQRTLPVNGQVAVVDPTGVVLPALRNTIAPEAIAARRDEAARRAIAQMPDEVRDVASGAGPAATGAAIERVTGPVPQLEIVERAADPRAAASDADLAAALAGHKAWLTTPGSVRHIALVVVHPDAVARAPGRDDFGGYDLYVPPSLDDRVEAVIFESVRDAIVDARVRAADLDRRRVDAIVRVPRARSVTVTRSGQRPTVGGFNRALPFVFVGLLLFAVLMGGQGLVTSTVEEKSSRVMEVLLSAVSPFELLAGKLLGQMGVSLVVLTVYIGIGLMLLVSFTLVGLLDLTLVFYLLAFFVITYLTIGAAMVAVGAAVNEMREAQQLMMPIILAMMIPWMLAPAIAGEPNSTFSTAISFIPPVHTFAMLLRLTSTAPPPAWQVWLTMAIGVAAVVATIWCAAKIFKVGLLMHGKPPDLATLVRWSRSA